MFQVLFLQDCIEELLNATRLGSEIFCETRCGQADEIKLVLETISHTTALGEGLRVALAIVTCDSFTM